MAGNRRVVVTGLGAVTAAGAGVLPFWRAAVEGRGLLARCTRFETSDVASPCVGQIPDSVLRRVLGAAGADPEPAAALAHAAALEALALAGVEQRALPPDAGLVLGTCLGGARRAFDGLAGGTVDPEALRCGGLSSPANHVASLLALEGPVLTLSSACVSGTAAVARAAACIRRGEADLMLAGGVDVLTRFVVVGFSLLRALASDEVRPFDLRRDGLALGEAAACLVLEERQSALRRGATALAELRGFGSSGDANHMTGPSPEGDGVVRALRAALEDAGMAPDAVDFINAHGTGTVFNDRMETLAIKRVFGEDAYRIPVDSIKPVVGHTLGAAGALEAILCVRVLLEGLIPPTLHYAEADPECDLDYVPNEARRVPVRCALTSSSAFAGTNAAILLSAP